MPAIDLSILNQRQTPAFYADTLANRPSAGFIGRIFVSTNTFEFYRDNGTTWDLIGGPGTSTVTGTGANGQVTYWNGTSSITGSNNLFFDAVNGHLGVGTITPGTALDVKHDQSTVVQLEQETATNDIRIAFINSGVGLWRLGAFYNAGANDFGLFDIAAAAQPLTVKRTTGQVLIGTSTVGSGKLVVASATSDNGIQIVGATAPSLRIDNAESGPTKRAGFGISTAVNNFIQGSADRDFCMFNGSTTASPILFGIYDAAAVNVQEAARISAARNFLIGTTTDIGRKLTVSGDGAFTSNGLFGGSTNPGNAGSFTVSVGVPGTTAGGLQLWAATNQSSFLQFGDSATPADNYRGFVGYNHNTDSLSLGTAATDRLTINSAGNVGIGTTNGDIFSTANATNILGVQATGTNQGGLIDISATGTGFSGVNIGTTSIRRGGIYALNGSALAFYTNPTNTGTALTENARFSSIGNLLIGTTTDAGQKLQVNGSSYISGAATFGSYVESIGFRATSSSAFGGTGVGVEIGYSGGLGYIQAYDRGTSAYQPMKLDGSTVSLQISGVEKLGIASTGTATFTNQVNIGNSVSAAVAVASTHKVSILIGGVQYYLLASNV